MKRCLKIMERMIVQNAENDIFYDYKYYEDNTNDPEATRSARRPGGKAKQDVVGNPCTSTHAFR